MITETWHNQRPTHQARPDYVQRALDEWLEAQMAYSQRPSEDNWIRLQHADQAWSDAWEQMEADHAATLQGECTCKPDGDACPVCVERNRQAIGEEIPFHG